MFQDMRNGAGVFFKAAGAIAKRPQLLLPLLVCWSLIATLVVWTKFFVSWRDADRAFMYGAGFGMIVFMSAAVSFGAFIMLEQVRQIEMGERTNILAAVRTGVFNLAKALPIVVIWAAIWLALSIVEVILRRRERGGSEEFNAENVARTLSGYERGSLSFGYMTALKRGVRMLAFLMFPAIAWERARVAAAIKRGLGIANLRSNEFATGFVLTEATALVVGLPLAILFFAANKYQGRIPDAVWFGVIIYSGFAWALIVLLEQLFVAELYLWHLIWERAAEAARLRGDPEPELDEVKIPSIMDGIADLHATCVGHAAQKRGNLENGAK